MKRRIYIFLDKTLDNPQKVVQGAHLALESGRTFNTEGDHPSIIVLAISTEEMDNIQLYLEKQAIKNITFFEPIFNKHTGIATEIIDEKRAKKLQHFSMMKNKHFTEQG